MTNLFSSYQTINAAQIVKSNIRSSHIDSDLTSLLKAFDILRSLPTREDDINDGFCLNRKIIQELRDKSGLLDLLRYFGFVRNSAGEYIYESTQLNSERRRRESGVNEIRDLSRDLRRARNGSLDEFEDFIRGRHSRRYSASSDTEEEERLPDALDINNGNIATIASVKSLKQSLVTECKGIPTHQFIRLRLARLAYKQKYPEARRVDDDIVDTEISQKITALKRKDKQSGTSRADYIYRECLTRTNFHETEALDMLERNLLNLEMPVQQPAPQTSAKAELDSIMEPLRQCWQSLNQQNNNNNNNQRFVRQISQADDRWNSVAHIVPAIQKLRQKSPGDKADDAIFRKCVECLVRIENLDLNTVKTYLNPTGGSQISCTFIENAANLLSVECELCVNSYPRNQIEPMYLCDHQCCINCARNYYRTTINSLQDANSLKTLTCFTEQKELTEETYMNFFQHLEGRLKDLFKDEPDVLRKYYDKTFHATRGQQIKNCGSSKCTGSFFVEENAPVARFRCPHCDFAQCAHCCLTWNDEHHDRTCDQYKAWLAANDPNNPDLLALKAVGSGAIVCPSCKQIYQYEAGGCEHFTCPNCKTDFCRICYGFFYSPLKKPCPLQNCTLKTGFHGHCKLNCFRELRDGEIAAMIEVLEDNDIDVPEELQRKPIASNKQCPVNGCNKKTTSESEHRLCENCYKQFLCSLIWDHELEPWASMLMRQDSATFLETRIGSSEFKIPESKGIYDDQNLQQILRRASIPIPKRAGRDDLIELCREHLQDSLGKPKPLTLPTA